VNHVEGNHLAVRVTPNHGSVARVFQCVTPNQIVELGNPDTDQPVAAIPVGKCIGKYPVQ
jgi:hypothetical protein